MSTEKVVLDGDDMRRTLVRIAHEIVEKNSEHERLAIVGIHRRGALLARRLRDLLGDLLEADVPLGELDISFYRDDLGRRAEAPTVHSTELDFALDGATVVIVDDVLFTGRTVRAAIEALFDYGRPARVQLAVLADWTPAAIVNAGDGKHEHPTQALLDVHTLRTRLGGLDGLSIWIVGDVLHSRVARSNILAFRKMGARVTVCGPPTLIPRGVEALGGEVRFTLDDLAEADVVYALRMQHERMDQAFVPTLREYANEYQINGRRLHPRQVLMHPGPVNRGVELSGEVVDSPQAAIPEQGEAGVVVRMAVLYEVLAGART